MNQERLMKIIVSPHVSEKSTTVADKNKQFVFRVLKDANKTEIKGAIELLFNVNVEGVQITNVRGKTRRFGQILGRKKSWKKAYVSLKKGQDINFANAEGV
ncbi:MAG: 50S ribosomal protein L23 [Gammaproteobacteria bacterium]